MYLLCHKFVLLLLWCIYCPPLFYCSVVPTTAVDAPVIDYIVDDRTPLLSSFQASRATSPLPHIAYLSLLFFCTRHMLLLRRYPIQLHSLSLSPLDYLSDILCRLYKYILYSSEPCTLLVNRIRIAGRDHSGSDRGYTTFYTTATGTVQSRRPKELTTAKLYRVAPIVISRVNPLISLLFSAL